MAWNRKASKIIAGNWKMNHGPTEALEFFTALTQEKPRLSSSDQRVIFPPAYCLSSETQAAARSVGLQLGAQNVHWEDKGAFTGELSAATLKKMGVEWCLIGHSERRQLFSETNDTATKRLKKALELGLNVIFCVGETLNERESNQTENVLKTQLQPVVALLKTMTWTGIFSVAYEPVWAIGTGKTATTEQASQAHEFIRSFFAKNVSADFSENLSVLYGGSVTPENAAALKAASHVDGVLVGGASLKAESFLKILA